MKVKGAKLGVGLMEVDWNRGEVDRIELESVRVNQTRLESIQAEQKRSKANKSQSKSPSQFSADSFRFSNPQSIHTNQLRLAK
jgi:hypothetical protein